MVAVYLCGNTLTLTTYDLFCHNIHIINTCELKVSAIIIDAHLYIIIILAGQMCKLVQTGESLS